MNATPAGSGLEKVMTPGRIAVAMIVLLAIALIREPAASPGSAWRFTTYSADPNGARGLFEVVEELGWKPVRRTTAFREDLDSTATYLVLDPAIELTAGEVGNLLAAVRRGAGLIYGPRQGTRLEDSLPLRSTGAGSAFSPPMIPSDSSYATPSSEVVSQNHIWPRAVLLAKRPLPKDTLSLFSAKLAFTRKTGRLARFNPVILRVPLGKGRVVAIADPTFLRNDVLRHGRTSVLAVRTIELARPDSTSRLVFDEFHHGFGTHANLLAAIARFLGNTPPGLGLLQLAIAGILLIAALGPRPLPPRSREITERRSALEHVDALAAAYEGAAAVRTVARRLARGLRRRHPIGSASTVGEVEYLALLRERRPAVATDALLLADACERGIVPTKLNELLAASDRIDQSLQVR